MTGTPLTPSPRRRSEAAIRRGFPFAAPVLAALCSALLYAGAVAGRPLLDLARMLCTIPVALAAWHRDDVRPGLIYAAFFSSAVLLTTSSAGGGDPARGAAIALVLVVVALLFAGLAGTLGSREALEGAAAGRLGLLARASSLVDVSDFLRLEALRDVPADEALLLVYHTAEDRWSIRSSEGFAPSPDEVSGAPVPLAAWLERIPGPVALPDLAADPRFVQPVPFRSLLARPILAADGARIGVLAVGAARPQALGSDDLAALAPLAAAAEPALVQAGAYAATGREISRLAARLASVQRTAREMNATPEPAVIARLAAARAVAVTGADAAAALAVVPGHPPASAVRGTVLSVAARLALEEAAALRWPRKEEPAAGAARIFLGSRSRIAAPIRRGDLHYGALVAESSRAEAFGVHDFQALQTLADHAAVALDNARLFGELRAEREKSDRIIRTMADGMLTLDGRGNVTAMNPAAELLTGWAEPDALGRAACAVVGCGRRPEPARSPIALGGAFPEGGNGHDPPALAPGPECAGTCKLMAALQLGVVVHEERWASRSPAGGERVFGLSAAPLPGEGAPSGVVVMLRDATEREEMERFQRELVATFSHELRAPLANIDAIIQTAALSPEAFPDDLVEKMRSQNRRLAELAERTLDVARLDDGRWRLEPRPLPAGMAASEAAERLAGRRPDRPVVVQAERPTPWAWGDEVAVATVLDNFLDNADKYSMPGAKVSVEVLRHPAGGVLFAVTDRGPGIAPEHRARVFDRFYRADGADSRRSYGHGLGLYIARRLVEGMGGRIWVESPETGGSRFVFTLPSPPEDGHEDPDHRG